jgi:hypothetical protein
MSSENELIARRRQLALRVASGEEDARAEYESVLAEIRDQENQQLLMRDAEVERQRLAAETETRRIAEERRQKEQALADKTREYHEMLGNLERQIYALAVPVENAIATSRELLHMTRELGGHMSWRIKSQIANTIKIALRDSLHHELGWVVPSQRFPLQPGGEILFENSSINVESLDEEAVDDGGTINLSGFQPEVVIPAQEEALIQK